MTTLFIISQVTYRSGLEHQQRFKYINGDYFVAPELYVAPPFVQACSINNVKKKSDKVMTFNEICDGAYI